MEVREPRHIEWIVRLALERDAADPRVTPAHAAQRGFGEHVGVAIILDGRSKHVFVALQRAGDAAIEHQRTAKDFLIQAADVDPGRIDRLAIIHTLQLRRQRIADGATIAVLSGVAHREPAAAGLAVFPEQARPHHKTRVAREVVPAVVIDVVLQLVMQAGGERAAKLLRQAPREEADAVGRAHGGLIEEHFADRIVAGAPRDQVDHSAHRARAVERRGHALDHLDLREIHRRNLQQAESADLLAGERQAIE